MTILPKKKVQEGKNSDGDFDDSRATRTNRVRISRDRSRPTTASEVNTNSDCSSASSLNSTVSRFEYTGEVEKREGSDCSTVPYKRTRHRPAVPTKLSSMSGIDGRGKVTRMHSDQEDNEDGYNSSDEHVPYQVDPDIAKVIATIFDAKRLFELLAAPGSLWKQLSNNQGHVFRSKQHEFQLKLFFSARNWFFFKMAKGYLPTHLHI